MSDLQRITADLEKARERLADLHSRVPAVNSAWDAATTSQIPVPNGLLAWNAQIKARADDVARLELQLVHAKLALGHWPANVVIEAMSVWEGPSIEEESGAPAHPGA